MTIIFRVLLKLSSLQQQYDFILFLKRTPCLVAQSFRRKRWNRTWLRACEERMRLACMSQRCALAVWLILGVGDLFGFPRTRSCLVEGKECSFGIERAGWTWLWCLGSNALFFFSRNMMRLVGSERLPIKHTHLSPHSCFSTSSRSSPLDEAPHP